MRRDQSPWYAGLIGRRLPLMSGLTHHRRASSGFALLVVLSTLTILTLLFAISSKRSLTHLRLQDTEATLAEVNFQKTELLQAVAARGRPEDQSEGAFEIRLGDESFQITMVDVGGLIDLNSAAPALLSAYFEALGLTPSDLQEFRTWRQKSRRLLRVIDLARIVNKPINSAQLIRTATVHSGRSGLAVEESPDELIEMIASLINLESYGTPASGVSYFIKSKDQIWGVLHYPPNGPARVLF